MVAAIRVRRWLARALVGGVAIGALAVTGWWWHSATMLRDGVLAWTAARRAEGLEVTHEAPTISGWPLTLRVSLARPHMGRGRVAWDGPEVIVETPVWAPAALDLRLPAGQRLSLPSGLHLLTGEDGSGRLAGDGGLSHLGLAFSAVTITASRGDPVTVGAVRIAVDQPQPSPADHNGTSLTLAVDAADVRVPGDLPAPFADGIRDVALRARIQGALKRVDADALAAWSNDGGVVEIDRLAIDWAPLAVDVNGTLTIDTQRQPMGAASVRVRGAQATVEAFRDRMASRDAAVARNVVSMLSRPEEDGGEPVLKAPVTVQDRTVFIGPLKVARVPEVRW